MVLSKSLKWNFPLLACACWYTAASGATLAEIRHRGYMVAAVSAEPSPYATTQNGKRIGFDAELLDRLRKSTPFEIRILTVAEAQLAESLTKGDADVVASSQEIKPSQQSAEDFLSPVAESTLYYLKRHDENQFKTVSDIGGRPLGIRSGSESFLALTEVEHRLAKQGKALGPVTEYSTDGEAYHGLESRAVDYVVNDIGDLAQTAKNNPGIFEIGQAVTHIRYVAWGVAKGNSDLAAFLNGLLAQERSSGNLVSLQKKWLGWTFPNLPVTVTVQDWWTARDDRPSEFPIPTRKDPD